MAKHWSKVSHYLCWNDPRSSGRRRVSFGTLGQMQALASAMTDEYDPHLYDGMGKPCRIRPDGPDPDPETGRVPSRKLRSLEVREAA
jgi:hypothetical protein